MGKGTGTATATGGKGFLLFGGGERFDRGSAACAGEDNEMGDDVEKSPVIYLSKADPETLQYRGGITDLYPYMQTADGAGSCLDIIYLLLRECPALVK